MVSTILSVHEFFDIICLLKFETRGLPFAPDHPQTKQHVRQRVGRLLRIMFSPRSRQAFPLAGYQRQKPDLRRVHQFSHLPVKAQLGFIRHPLT